MLRQFWVRAGEYAVVETLHTFRTEWRIEGTHLINDASERPNVTLLIIRFLLPDFWASIVRRSRLCVQHAILSNFTHIKVAHFKCAVRALEDIGGFEVSVENVSIMQGF